MATALQYPVEIIGYSFPLEADSDEKLTDDNRLTVRFPSLTRRAIEQSAKHLNSSMSDVIVHSVNNFLRGQENARRTLSDARREAEAAMALMEATGLENMNHQQKMLVVERLAWAIIYVVGGQL